MRNILNAMISKEGFFAGAHKRTGAGAGAGAEMKAGAETSTRCGDRIASGNVGKRISIPGNEKTGVNNASVNLDSSANTELINSTRCIKRYIPATLKRQAVGKTNGRCFYSNCLRPYDVIHHRERFSNNKSHDSIIPLCHTHHEFAHNGLIQNEREEPQTWRIILKEGVEQMADVLFRKYRRT